MTEALRSPLEEAVWADIEPRATAIPKELRKALKSLLKPDDKLWTAQYPFGDLIVDHGSLVLPDRTSPADTALLKTICSEKPPPLCLVLSRSVEVFLAEKNHRHAFPLQLIGPGAMFGVFEALDRLYKVEDNPGIYSVSSGCRSIWILGASLKGVSSAVGRKLGNRTNIEWDKDEPHYKFVKRTTAKDHPWHSEVLFFPNALVARAANNKTFERLLYSLGWRQSAYGRRQMIAYDEEEGRIKQWPQYHRLIQHLNSLHLGQLPAYRLSHRVPVDSGPFQVFQKNLYEVLRDKKTRLYYPFILQPAQLQNSGDAGFYSFSKSHPYLTPANTTQPFDHCANVHKLFKATGSAASYRFFCNGSDGKVFKEHPLGDDHYDLQFDDFLNAKEAEELNTFLGHEVTSEEVCLKEGFLNTGVIIRR